MKVNIEFHTDNASFEDDFYGALAHTINQFWRKIRHQLQREEATKCNAPEAEDQIFDENGNVIGSIKITR